MALELFRSRCSLPDEPGQTRLAGRLAVLVLGLIVSGCGPQAPSTERTSVAPNPLVRNAQLEFNARLIENKRRLQQDPNSASARYGLGMALLELGDLRSAETELNKAFELGFDPAQAFPALLKTQLLLGKHRDVIDLYGSVKLTDPKAAAEVKITVAEAHAVAGERDKAKALIEAALADHPGSVRAQGLNARGIATSVGRREALRLVEQLLQEHPEATEAWQLKGDLLRLDNPASAEAVAAYEQGLKSNPRHMPTHATLIAMALDAADLPTARARLSRQQEYFPAHAQSRYYEARLADAEGKLEVAQGIVQRLLVDHPADLRYLLLAATVDLKMGALRGAEDYLARALTIAPSLARTRHLLAQTYLASGAPAKAQLILEPLVRHKQPDAVALGLAAEAALQSGLTLQAGQLFERAAAADPGNARYRAALAMARIARGDFDTGFRELESAAATDKSTFADMALLSARLRAGDLPAAMRAAEASLSKQPDNPVLHWQLGRLKLQAKRAEDARKHFEAALQANKAYAPAALALAELDLQARAPDAARGRLGDVLKKNPNDLDALLALAEISARAGEPERRVIEALESATRLHPSQRKAWLALVDYLIQTGHAAAALTAAQSAAGALPLDYAILDALGRAQLADGQAELALATFRKIAADRPRAPGPQLRMAEVHARVNNVAAALEAVRQADKLQPGDASTQALWVTLAIKKRQWPEALAVARKAQQMHPKEPLGFKMEGMVLAAQQRWDEALAAFSQAEMRRPETTITMLKHSALLQSGKPEAATRLMTQWLETNPRDTAFLSYLGDLALADKKFTDAELHYRKILDIEPNNVEILNNLAWVLLELGKSGATALASQALKLQPRRADVMDTLSRALASDSNLPAAIQNQKRAVQLQPDRPMLRLHLARLAMSGKDYPLARAELDKLSALGKSFPAQTEVWQLRQQLP